MINSKGTKKYSWLLFSAVFFQVGFLASMVGVSAMPLWTGDEVKVKTVPIDPRSLLRGNYARLNYAFSSIDAGPKRDPQPKKGSVIYVQLQPSANDDYYEYADWALEKPESGVFIRGRVTRAWCSTNCNLRVKYGIEAFFAPKEKALALESDLRETGMAVLMVSKGGNARIKEIEGLSDES